MYVRVRPGAATGEETVQHQRPSGPRLLDRGKAGGQSALPTGDTGPPLRSPVGSAPGYVWGSFIPVKVCFSYISHKGLLGTAGDRWGRLGTAGDGWGRLEMLGTAGDRHL